MKQELPTADTNFAACSRSPPPPARSRVSRTKDSPRAETANGVSPGSKARPKPVPQDSNSTHRAARSILLNRLKPGGGDDVGAPKEREMEEPKITSRPGSRAVEQFARLRRRPDTNCKGSENGTDGKTGELQRRLEASELLVRDLQSEASALKAQLEKLQSLNVELESRNKHLVGNLSAAEAKIASLERYNQMQVASISREVQPCEFNDVRKLIANKLDHFRTKKEIVREDSNSKFQSPALEPGAKAVEIQPKVPMMKPSPPPPVQRAPFTGAPPPPPPPARCAPATGPPPPPPPPPPTPARANTMQRASAIVELYHSLTKRDGMKDNLGSGNRASHVANNAHNSIVGELQNRSAHLLAIRADVETKGDFIKHLIEKVQCAAYTDMEDVLIFVDWLDGQLSTLADERAVLKHFNWPERKADALREAAFEYRDLKRLELEVSSFEDDASLPCEASLKKIEGLLDKLERSIHRLIKLRDASMLSYRGCSIPTDWMLDSGMVRKMKLASVKLAKVYMKRLSTELELLRHSERESLLFQGVRFAYRAHQFAGGLDPETMHAFEELRERVQAHGKGSRELIPGIRLS